MFILLYSYDNGESHEDYRGVDNQVVLNPDGSVATFPNSEAAREYAASEVTKNGGDIVISNDNVVAFTKYNETGRYIIANLGKEGK